MTEVRRGLAVGLAVLALAGCGHTGESVDNPRFTLSGVVRAEPGCPGPERLDSPCPPRPVADATVEADQDGHEVGRTTTDQDGHFSLSLAPGTYQVTASGGGGLNTGSTRTVVVNADADITLTVDSGMR